MKNLNIASKLTIVAIWGSAIPMMAIVGVFGRGNPVAMAAPPIAAGAATFALVKDSKDSQDKEKKELSAQAGRMKMLEMRLENLEEIATKDNYSLIKSRD
ncbi:hypothetical protein IQ230_15860 [Gloeocapsopsis crepidinum LEGE 06123]|uniref:Uncharacterized protein n=1 Tax=Gloeocapsopsis crepidinum LEGE 06123 TaxID=588587 RepID=A0ABR9UWW2_9CHRO|nr:hypothetical protein [Gloeocapsopsis crepidinum]MBE9191798.1 hypothetical protein [Gloeocapsopsis crepidinum LEGE 06123]